MIKKTLLASAAGIALVAGAASAGGLDRSGQSVAAIFAPGNAGSVSFGVVKPSISGGDLAGGGTYEDVGETYTQTTLSFTNAINESLSYSVIVDQPFGVDLDYTSDPNTTMLGGTRAGLDSTALNIAGRYKISDRFSVFGGVGIQKVEANIALNGLAYKAAIGDPAALTGVTRGINAQAGTSLTNEDVSSALAGSATSPANAVFVGLAAAQSGTPITAATMGPLLAAGRANVQDLLDGAQASFSGAGGYQFNLESSTAPSYFIGAAYEIPSIALRVAGTYRFETTHKADGSESIGATNVGTNQIEFKTPASFNLEAQTGIAEGTLLTFNYRWAEWGSVDVVPVVLGQDLVNLDDTERFSLGIARRFNEKFAGSVTVSYEAETGDPVSPLGPTDGLLGLSIGGQYSHGGMNISGGINYTKVGDATAEVGNTAVAQFADNHVIGVGFKIDFTF